MPNARAHRTRRMEPEGKRMGRLIRRVLSARHRQRRCTCWTAIYLGTTLPQPSSGLPGNSAGSLKRSLSDLAPDEVYPAGPITRAAGGLLHHRFTLTCRRGGRRSAFCCTFSRIAPGGCYPPSCSAEPGRSSASAPVSRTADDATVLPTHSPVSLSRPSPAHSVPVLPVPPPSQSLVNPVSRRSGPYPPPGLGSRGAGDRNSVKRG